MIKYFCDECGKEVSERWVLEWISDWSPGKKHYCRSKKCAQVLDEILFGKGVRCSHA
jgi:hypothetical protein